MELGEFILLLGFVVFGLWLMGEEEVQTRYDYFWRLRWYPR